MDQLTLQQTFALALQHHQAGRLAQAEPLYRQVLAEQPDHAGALHLLGVLAHQVGRHDAAVELLRRAVALRPGWPEAHSNLGEALKAQREFDQAIAEYRLAIDLNPDYAEAHNNLGSALQAKGQLDEALAEYRAALALKPNYPGAYNNLGNTLRDKGELDEAVVAYRQAIALRPGFAEAHGNLGNALKDKGQTDEAIAAYRQAIALKPAYAEAHSNLGTVLKATGDTDDAIAAYRQALALKPNYPEAHNNLGNALKDKGQLDQAMAAYRQALALKPGYSEAHSNLVYTMYFQPGVEAAAIAREYRRWNQQHAEPLQRHIRPPSTSSGPVHANEPNPDRRLRIGYVSADFRTHASACFLLPLLAHHNPRQVELFAYAQVVRPDAMTDRLKQHVRQWRSSVGLSDQQLAEQIRQDQIDILVDLKLHTADNRLLAFACKPAPVQATWLGYPGSSGLTTIDYRLSDPYLDPPGMDESIYSEQTIRLPDTFWCYDPLDGREIAVNSLPALASGVVTFGSLNNFCKLNDELLALWGKVMREVNQSRLLLLASNGDHRQRTLDRLAQEGIAPSRVEFAPRQPRRGYLELYQRIDLGLDSYPVNGHTTSLDSFWMGVPVVTLVGPAAMGRAGWCQLSNLGLPDLAGHTPGQFVQIAASLANDLPRLQALRATLRQRLAQSPLMDAPRFAGNVESAYRRMWRRWCATACGK